MKWLSKNAKIATPGLKKVSDDYTQFVLVLFVFFSKYTFESCECHSCSMKINWFGIGVFYLFPMHLTTTATINFLAPNLSYVFLVLRECIVFHAPFTISSIRRKRLKAIWTLVLNYHSPNTISDIWCKW